MNLSNFAPLALAAGYIYKKEQDFVEIQTKIQKSIKEQEERMQEREERLNTAMMLLKTDVDNAINYELKGDFSQMVKCDADIHISSYGTGSIIERFWNAAFYINITNISTRNLYMKGVRMIWTINNYTSVWMPYWLGSMKLKPGTNTGMQNTANIEKDGNQEEVLSPNTTYNMRLTSANSRKLFDTREARKAVIKAIKNDTAEVSCELQFLLPPADATVTKQDIITFIKDVPGIVSLHGRRSYSNDKNGAFVSEFNNAVIENK